MRRAQGPNESHSRSSRKGGRQRHSTSSGMRKRHSKAMRAPRRHVRREVGIGIRPPTDHDEIAGEVAEQDIVLDLHVLCGTGHAEAHVPLRGSLGRARCGLNVRLPDTHVAAAVFSGAAVDMLEIRLCTGAKAAAGGAS